MADYKDLASDVKKNLREEVRVLKFRNEKLHKLVERMQEEAKEDELIINDLVKELDAIKRKYVPDLTTIAGIKNQVPKNDLRVMDDKRRQSYAKRWIKGDKKQKLTEDWIRTRILENKELK